MGTSEGERSVVMALGDSMTTVSGLTRETVKWQQRPVVVLESTVSLSPLKLLKVSVCFFDCGNVPVVCYSHPQQMSTSV